MSRTSAECDAPFLRSLPRSTQRPPRLVQRAVEPILHAVGEGLPGRLDHVLRDADRAPTAVVVRRLDEDADLRRRALLDVDDADFEVGEADVAQLGVEVLQRL